MEIFFHALSCLSLFSCIFVVSFRLRLALSMCMLCCVLHFKKTKSQQRNKIKNKNTYMHLLWLCENVLTWGTQLRCVTSVELYFTLHNGEWLIANNDATRSGLCSHTLSIPFSVAFKSYILSICFPSVLSIERGHTDSFVPTMSSERPQKSILKQSWLFQHSGLLAY